jgi:hypothetical protein
MFSLLIYSRIAWNDYFSGNPNSLNSNAYTSRQTPLYTNLYISNCLFISTSSLKCEGGALCCYNSVTYFLIESTSFFSCNATGSGNRGGAIYFSHSSSGQCVLYKVCGCDCCCTGSGNYGVFGFISVNDTASSKNYVNYSSIVRCVDVDSSTYFAFVLEYGKNCCSSVNSSLNKCYCYSGISCYPYCDSNHVTCSLTYSSFVDNTATERTCVWLYRIGARFEIKSCNTLRNTQGNLDSQGTIFTTGNLNIYDSCILQNTANKIFFQYSSSCTITLTNCTVDKTSNNGYLTIRNTVRKSFTLELNHMSIRNCHSEYDSFEYWTKKEHHCTCEYLPCRNFRLFVNNP